eukprot:45907-Pyramimonas_sp.AAC.1
MTRTFGLSQFRQNRRHRGRASNRRATGKGQNTDYAQGESRHGVNEHDTAADQANKCSTYIPIRAPL